MLRSHSNIRGEHIEAASVISATSKPTILGSSRKRSVRVRETVGSSIQVSILPLRAWSYTDTTSEMASAMEKGLEEEDQRDTY